MDVLSWAEMSLLGDWIATSVWGYPIALTLHTVGMGTLVGIAFMICLRIWGLGALIPPSSLIIYWRVALAGFALNLLSGMALFFGSATSMWESWPFRIKLGLIVIGMATTHCLVLCLFHSRIHMGHKLVALGVFTVWVSALVCGRLIAYIF